MTTRKNKATGIAALIGIGAGVFAWWKYRNMSDAEKSRIKGKINQTGDKLKETYTDVENSISDKYNKVKNSVKKEVEQVQS